MARTLTEIYQELADEKATMTNLANLQPNIDSLQTLLSDLTTTSKVAMWRLFFYVVAFCIWTSEVYIEKKIAEKKPGNEYWYYQLCLNFQYGDPLVLSDGEYIYSTIDESHKIIKYAAADEDGDGNVILKVAKDSSGIPNALSAGQLTAFKEYIKFTRFAGTSVIFISEVADTLKTAYTIHYDPLVLASDGSLLSSPSTFPVNDAITNYIKNLVFNGVFSVQKLTDEIQNASGVKIAVCTMCEAKYGLIPYTDILAAVAQQYRANAGYLSISVAGGETLADTITYQAYV